MDHHQHLGDEQDGQPQAGFRLSWPGHDQPAAHPARKGRLLDLLPLRLSAFASRRGLTGWPVKLSSPGS
ncbi:MAG TPA: hypothetical protein VLL76_08420 [Candidatus Omnitrophota bacterium]|nr:hypothetical protein [Candidatus Omnitrophota bacterium]